MPLEVYPNQSVQANKTLKEKESITRLLRVDIKTTDSGQSYHSLVLIVEGDRPSPISVNRPTIVAINLAALGKYRQYVRTRFRVLQKVSRVGEQ